MLTTCNPSDKHGRTSHLKPGEVDDLVSFLKTLPYELPPDHGFRTDLWSARRIVELIRRHFEITFHPASLRRWLRERGYSSQRPAKKARQRNDETIGG